MIDKFHGCIERSRDLMRKAKIPRVLYFGYFSTKFQTFGPTTRDREGGVRGLALTDPVSLVGVSFRTKG